MANMRTDAMSIRDSGNEYLVEMSTLQNGNYDVCVLVLTTACYFPRLTPHSSYMVPLKVGTPPQTVYVQVDTGSSDLWVPSTVCDSCSGKSQYDASSSSTSKKQSGSFEIQYGDGSTVSGPVYTETGK